MVPWKHLAWVVAGVCGVLTAMEAGAEWLTQRILLQPGWNAIYFEVQPEQNACDEVFEDLPVRSVWAWNERFSPVQYVRNPDELVPEQPEWLTYFPEDSGRSFLSDLYAVHAGRTYLVEIDSDEPMALDVRGRAVYTEPDWTPESFNLVGFSIDPEAPPTFQKFFEPEPALRGQPIYRLDASGAWQRVTAPAQERLRTGEAYWVYCDGESSYAGPLELALDASRSLDFGVSVTERMLGFANRSDKAKQVTVELLPSTAPPGAAKDGSALSLAGNVALAYQRVVSWQPLSEALTFELEPYSERGVKLAVRRADMTAKSAGYARYGGILRITDDSGKRYHVAVTALKNSSRAGLWAGTVEVNKVSEAGNPEDSTTPTEVSSEFRFRIIVHMDADGQARLLQQVVVMQVEDDESGEDGPTDATGTAAYFARFLEERNARVVLLTDDTLIPEYEGIALRDGEIVGRRISSPVFSFSEPAPMTGKFTTRLRLEDPLVIDYDDPLNPFVHRFHPDHDNLDERYETMLGEGSESYTFTRMITLDFTDQDPEDLGLPNWGYDLLGGTYREAITGVHREDIFVEGTFRLHKISDTPVLNDGR